MFIAEGAAWWGYWERLVRSVKECLRRVLALLNFEELMTLLAKVDTFSFPFWEKVDIAATEGPTFSVSGN